MVSQKCIMDQEKELSEQFDELDIDNPETYKGKKFSHCLIFTLIINDIRWFEKLESKISEHVYYRFLNYIHYHQDDTWKLLNEYKISARLEKMLVHIYNNPDKHLDKKFRIVLKGKSIPKIFVLLKKGNKSGIVFSIERFPFYIDLHTTAGKISNNPHSSYQLLRTMYDYIIKSEYPAIYFHNTLNSIKNHPNFSTAKAILKEMEAIS